MIEKIKQWIMNFFGVQKINNKLDKLSLTQVLFRYVVYLCIGCVALDLIVPMYLKWQVLHGEINLVQLGLDPAKFFRIVPSETYTFLNFFLATMAGIYGWRKSTDASLAMEVTKNSNGKVDDSVKSTVDNALNTMGLNQQQNVEEIKQ